MELNPGTEEESQRAAKEIGDLERDREDLVLSLNSLLLKRDAAVRRIMEPEVGLKTTDLKLQQLEVY